MKAYFITKSIDGIDTPWRIAYQKFDQAIKAINENRKELFAEIERNEIPDNVEQDFQQGGDLNGYETVRGSWVVEERMLLYGWLPERYTITEVKIK